MPYIAATATSLLAACLAPLRDHIVETQRLIETVIVNRASKIIAKDLTNPELAPDLLCR